MNFVRWNKETEIEDLLSFNVGIMPLPDDVWTKGKCGFKALQYLSLGIPAVVSDVGVNSRIVEDNVNGCICRTPDDWYNALSRLMTEKDFLQFLSSNARQKVVREYSVRSNTPNFLRLFPGQTTGNKQHTSVQSSTVI
jgi:glycosyltransferase involved in cell wall biosynthesis